MKKVQFDVDKLLRSLNGPTRAAIILNHHGYEVERDTLYKWRQRKHMPPEWAWIIFSILEDTNGTKLELGDFIICGN